MQVILQGSLRHFPPVELLTFLCGRGQSGTLDLETTGKRTRVFFEKDKIVWAESSKGGEITEAILQTFEWTAGTFSLLDTVALPENVKPVALEVAKLIDEAKLRAMRATVYRDTSTFRVVDDLAIQQQINLNADELRLLFKLTSVRSFQKLIEELGVTRQELTERLQHLEQLGLLQREDPATTTPGTVQLRRRTLVGSLTPDGAPDNVFPLLDGECSIGRAPANTVAIADGSVSSHHAKITRTAEGFVLEDLQSRNGTFVNGEKVTEKRLLVDGDLVRLGKVILTFNVARELKSSDTTLPEMNVPNS